MQISDRLALAKRARTRGDCSSAEQILEGLLTQTRDNDEREEIIREMYYLYRSPMCEEILRAESCLREIENIDPSALNAMEWAIFMLQRELDAEAETWSHICVDRAKQESNIELEYSAICIAGLVAARRRDTTAIMAVIARLETLIAREHSLPFGDEVQFLEAAAPLGGAVQDRVVALARMLVPKIEDASFRARASSIAAQ